MQADEDVIVGVTYLISRDCPSFYAGRAKRDKIVRVVGETPTQWITDDGKRFQKKKAFPQPPRGGTVTFEIMRETLEEHQAKVEMEAELDLVTAKFQTLKVTRGNFRKIGALLKELGKM